MVSRPKRLITFPIFGEPWKCRVVTHSHLQKVGRKYGFDEEIHGLTVPDEVKGGTVYISEKMFETRTDAIDTIAHEVHHAVRTYATFEEDQAWNAGSATAYLIENLVLDAWPFAA